MFLKKYAVERESQRLERALTDFRFELAFPHHDAVPAQSCELMTHLEVTFLVASHFLLPKWCVRFRDTIEPTPFMTMPETPIDKHTSMIFSEHYIRLPWQTGIVEPIAEAMAPEITPHHLLWFGVLAVDGCHVGVALR